MQAETLKGTVLLFLILGTTDLLHAKERRAVSSSHVPGSPASAPGSADEPAVNKEPCPSGTVPHNNGSICCQPIACDENQEVRVCDVNLGEDMCINCTDGYILPSRVSSLDQNAHCFKVFRKNECSGPDLKPYHTVIDEKCHMHCECKYEDCFWEDPCGCNRSPICSVNEQLNKTTGVCEPCPPYTYKNTPGCEPCTYNISLWRSGLPSPTSPSDSPTSPLEVESSSLPVNDEGNSVTEKDLEVKDVQQPSSISNDALLILVIVLIVVLILVSVTICLVVYCRKHSHSCFHRPLCRIKRIWQSCFGRSYDPVTTTVSIEAGVVPIDAKEVTVHRVLIPRKDANGNLPANGVGTDNIAWARAAGITDGDDGRGIDGDADIEVDINLNEQLREGEQTVREGPLGAESDLLSQQGSPTSTVETSLDSDRMSIPGQAARSEAGNNAAGISAAGVGSNVPKTGDSCLQCLNTRLREVAESVNASGNVLFMGNHLKNCNVVLCSHKHAKSFVQGQDLDQCGEVESADSSVKVAEVKSGIVAGRQTEGNTAAVRPTKPSRQSSNVSSDSLVRGEIVEKSNICHQNVPGTIHWNSNGSGKKPVATIRPMQAVLPESARGTNTTSLPHSESDLSSTSYQLLHHDPQYNRGNMVADVNEFESFVSGNSSELNPYYSNVNGTGDDIEDSQMGGVTDSGGGVPLLSPTNHVCCNCCRTSSGSSCYQDCPQNFPGSVRPRPEGESEIGRSVETGHGQSSRRRHCDQTFCKSADTDNDDETGLKSVEDDVTECKRMCNFDSNKGLCCNANENVKVAEEVSMCNNFEGKTNGTLASTDESFEIGESEINRMLEVETMSEMTSEMRGEGTERLTACDSDTEEEEADLSFDEMSNLGQRYGFVPPRE